MAQDVFLEEGFANASMSTIAAGQVAGMSRAAALEFSFFLSIPVIAALHILAKHLREKDPGEASAVP